MTDQSSSDAVRFIPDVAADIDFFGSHQRVANAIVETVRQPDVKMVGLIGPWGSGKSTVVKLVEKALRHDKNQKFRVFSFDAWMHQSDPPRRAFLEQFIAFLEAEDLGEHGAWDHELNELHRLVEKTKSKTTPILTQAGRWFLVTLFMLPLGLAFAGKPWYDIWAAGIGPARFLFPTALLLIISPALVAILLYLKWRTTWNPRNAAFWTLGNWCTHKKPHHKQSILSLIANRNVTRQVNKTFKAPEPSAIEFQAMFRKILGSLKAPAPHLIIVIDNLDRIAREEAVVMWTTIRGFFLGAITKKDEKSPAILPTVLLPIDESAAMRASQVGKELDAGLARSFLDKTFDVTFHVTEPVLSDWKAYLAQRLRDSFGSAIQEEWIFETARIYRFKADSGVLVTPRDINKTVAAIVSLWLQWKPIPIPYVSIAYYAIYRDEFKVFAEGINRIRVDITDQDAKWEESLAALHYGVTPEQAVQVFLDSPLRSAVTNKSQLGMEALIGKHGFGAAFERLVDDPGFMEPRNIGNAAIMLSVAGIEPANWLEFAWRKLRQLYLRTNLWTNFAGNAQETAKALIDNCPSGALSAFMRALVEQMSAWSQTDFQQPEFRSFAVGMIELVARRAHDANITLPGLTVRADDKQFLWLAAELVDQPEAQKLINSRRTALQREKLVAAFQAKFETDDEDANLEAMAQIALATEIKSWDAVADVMNATVEEVEPSEELVSTAAFVLGALVSKTDKVALNHIKALAQTGRFQSMINAAHAAQNQTVMACAIALQILGEVQVAAPNGDWTALIAEAPSLPSLVDDLMSQWKIAAFMRPYVTQLDHDMAINALIKPIISQRVRRGALGRLHIDQIIANPKSYSRAIDVELRAPFFEQLVTYDTFWERLTGAGVSDGALTISRVLISSTAIKAEHRKQARQLLAASLKAVPVDDWIEAIQEGFDEPFDIAKQLQQLLGRPLALGMPLYDALSKLMAELIASNERPYLEHWFRAAELLGVNHRRTLFRTLRDHLLSMTPPPRMEQLFMAGGQGLLEDGDFLAKSDESVRYVVKPLMSPEGLPWLLQQVERVSLWLARAEKETRNVLIEHGRGLLSEFDGEDKARLELLLQQWRVKASQTIFLAFIALQKRPRIAPGLSCFWGQPRHPLPLSPAGQVELAAAVAAVGS